MNHDNQSNEKTLSPWNSPYDLACTVLAITLGLAVGWLDLQVTEVSVTILALLTASLLLGLLRPAAAWRWPILIAIGLPIMAAVAVVIGMKTVEPVQIDFRITLAALAIALIGSYIGVFIRYTVRSK